MKILRFVNFKLNENYNIIEIITRNKIYKLDIYTQALHKTEQSIETFTWRRPSSGLSEFQILKRTLAY